MRARVWFRFRSARAIAFGLALSSGVASAQAGEAVPNSGVQAEAADRYERGVKAFEDGRWREAVELFRQADELAPSALLSLNIAKVYERMRDSRNALASYRDYLRRSPAAAEQASLQKRVAELEALLRAQGVQQLSVLSTPPGATVLLDTSSRGVTPWTGELAPGQHRLQLTLRGYADVEQSFELPADHAIDLTFPLAPSAASAEAAPAEVAPGRSASSGTGAAAPSMDAPSVNALSMDAPSPALERPVAVPRWWTWGLFGGSGALLLGSGAVELARRSLQGEAHDTHVQIDYKRDLDGVQSRRDTARVLLGLGAVFGIAGGVSLYFDLRHAEAAAGGLAVACGPEVCGARVSQTW